MRQFGTLLRHHRKIVELQIQRADYRAGVIAALIWNTTVDLSKTQAREPQDFFMSLKHLKSPEKPRQSQAAMFKMIEALATRSKNPVG